jgi:allophanate hydrolase
LWSMPLEAFGAFVQTIPAPLGIGTVHLSDGAKVQGFVCESHGAENARDITSLGDWRRFLSEAE